MNYSKWDLEAELSQHERENIELYSDPEFRRAKTKEYADNLHEERVSTVSGKQEWLILRLCKQELHDLYRKEPKYLDSRSVDCFRESGKDFWETR